MGLYNFHARFVPMILAGTKTHTIRAPRAHPDKPGNTLHLYSGLRTKNSKLLRRAKCTRVDDIEIERYGRVYLAGKELSGNELEALAVLDGFENFADMLAYWHGKLPFKGQIIHWAGRVS